MSGETPKRALVTGLTGQDGSYLAELLLEKGYEVHGIIRRSSSFNTGRIEHLYKDPHEPGTHLFSHYGDLTDPVALTRLIYELQPRRDLQPRRPEPRPGLLRHPRVHRRRHRGRHAAAARGDPRVGGEDALLPGLLLGDVRLHAPAPERGDAVSPAQPLRRRQGRRLLDHGQLPRGLRDVRRQRHPLQPRVAAARRDLRHPQDHPRRRADQGGPAGEALPGQPRRRARLGLRAATTSRRCG